MIFALSLYRKVRDVYIVVSLSPICALISSLTASADGMSASHVKVNNSLMTGQQVLVSYVTALPAHIYASYGLSLGASSSRPSLEIFYSGVKSGFVAKINAEGLHRYPRESVRLFARTSRHQPRVSLSITAHRMRSIGGRTHLMQIYSHACGVSERKLKLAALACAVSSRSTLSTCRITGLCGIANIVGSPFVT